MAYTCPACGETNLYHPYSDALHGGWGVVEKNPDGTWGVNQITSTFDPNEADDSDHIVCNCGWEGTITELKEQ